MAEQQLQQEANEDLIARFIGGEDDSPICEEMPIPLDYEGIVDEDLNGLVQYDVDKFKKGVKDYSYIAGAFTALRNSGMSEENVMRWLLGEVEEKCLSKQLASQEKVAQTQTDIVKRNEY